MEKAYIINNWLKNVCSLPILKNRLERRNDPYASIIVNGSKIGYSGDPNSQYELYCNTKVLTVLLVAAAADITKTNPLNIVLLKSGLKHDTTIGDALVHNAGILPNKNDIFLKRRKYFFKYLLNLSQSQLDLILFDEKYKEGPLLSRYSCAGYHAIGIRLQEIFEMPFRDILKKVILEPLKIENISWSNGYIPNPADGMIMSALDFEKIFSIYIGASTNICFSKKAEKTLTVIRQLLIEKLIPKSSLSQFKKQTNKQQLAISIAEKANGAWGISRANSHFF